MILYYCVLALHIVVCLVLITIILVQGGRGGLGEALGGGAAQSLFGGGTSTVIAKVTAFSGGAFMITCLTLAMLSTAQGKSIIDQVPAALPSVLAPPLEDVGPISPVSSGPAASQEPAPVASETVGEPEAVVQAPPEEAPAVPLSPAAQ